jgi:hypothetical protein
MVLTGKILIWARILGATGFFAFGFVAGRQLPTRHFEKFGDTRYLLEPATGRVCDPFKDPKENPFPQFAVDPATGKTPAETSGTKPTYPPACGK